jgi:hypothetical protein
MKRNSMTYCELELISDDEWNASHSKSAVKRWLQSIAKFVTDILLSSDEPKIWTTYDRFGAKRWHLYDLSIRQTFTFESEYEILIWLDGRYSRS